MPRIISTYSHSCARSLRTGKRRHVLPIDRLSFVRTSYHTSPQLSSPNTRHVDIEDVLSAPPQPQNNHASTSNSSVEAEQGAMSRRLQSATEDALYEGGRAGRKAVEEAGFSEELKAQILDRIAGSNFKSTHAASITEASLPSYAGRGSRDVAISQPWTDTEQTGDAVLRMLDDAHKPIKPSLGGRDAAVVDLRLSPRTKQNAGQRLAAALEKTANYELSQDPSIGVKEREELRASIRERYGSAAKAEGRMPTSFRGLEGLANERIEDAIARGQFKDILRGQGALDLTRHGNPFIDTTEYLLNNMIKRQEIVPPWIEKQQEVVSTADNFRERIRMEWKRQAARTISSRGGSIEEQIHRAQLYAAAEQKHNPRKRDVAGTPGRLTAGGNPLMQPLIQEVVAAISETGFSGPAAAAPATPTTTEIPSSESSNPVTLITEIGLTPPTTDLETLAIEIGPSPIAPGTPLPAPLRDDAWLATEQSYLELCIKQLNDITRSYNLMAPELAKKPYFSLDRELKNMYADVAAELPSYVLERSRAPKGVAQPLMKAQRASIMEGFASIRERDKRKIYDERKEKSYGFMELLQDWFGAGKVNR